MFYNRWESGTVEAVERPLRALLLLLQAQGVRQFEEITANLFSLFALISMLKRVETCRGYDRTMKAAMDSKREVGDMSLCRKLAVRSQRGSIVRGGRVRTVLIKCAKFLEELELSAGGSSGSKFLFL